VTAAGQTEIAAAHLDPLEVSRRGEHLAHQLVIAGLDPRPLAQSQLRLGDPFREVVPQLLELTQVKDPRLAGDRADAVRNLDSAEGLGEESGELALEMADLTPQLSAGKALVDLDVEPSQAVSYEQIRHWPTSECRSRSGHGKPEAG
jgi:hypothetical protein